MVANPIPIQSPTDFIRCPRCERSLAMGYDEPECLTCGYADYSYTIITRNGMSKNPVSSGTAFVVRYGGDASFLDEVTTVVKAQRKGNRLVLVVQCPFCGNGNKMEESSLSGKRREAREERFKCNESHRLSLTPGKHGAFTWK